MDWYKHYPGDYMSDTAHLTLLEHGAYRLMLDHYYSTQKPLPADINRIYRLVRAVTDDERNAVNAILDEYFTLTDDGYTNDKCNEIIAKYEEQAAHNRSVGRLGGRPKKPGINPEHNPEHNPEITQVVSKTKPGTEPGNNPIPDTRYQNKKPIGQTGFDRWWAEYPKKVKKKTAGETWKRKRLDEKTDELITDIKNRLAIDRRWKEGYVPDPTTYLNQERWNDEIDSTENKPKQKGDEKPNNQGILAMARSLGITPKPGEDYDTLYRRCLAAGRG